MIVLDALCCRFAFGLAEEGGTRAGKLHQVAGLIKAGNRAIIRSSR
jgi:hypothetical protein